MENIRISWNIDKSEIESFTYTVSDGYNPEDTAPLAITVEGRDDAPVITSITGNDRPLHVVDGILDVDGDDNGDLVIEIEDVREDEIIEVEVDSSGTINIVDFL